MTRARTLSRLANSDVLAVDSSNNVGIGSTIPDAKLDVIGIVSATTFYGDGSNLDNVTSTTINNNADNRLITGSGTANTLNGESTCTYDGATFVTPAATVGSNVTVNDTGLNVSGVITATSFTGDVTGDVTGTAGGLSGSPDITINNLVGVAATFSGVVTYEDVTNVDSIGIITARSGIRVGSGQSIGSDGALTYYGDGSQLSGISAGGIGTASGTAAGIVTTLYLSDAQDHKMTASGITTITCYGGSEGESHTVRITNSGITTVGFSTYFLWPSGSAPSIPTADGTISLISFTVQRVGTAGTQLLAGASLNYS